MRLLLFGASGQVGTDIRRHCPESWELVLAPRTGGDLRHPERAASLVQDVDVVINAAAYTSVDQAESEADAAFAINAAAPAALAQAAATQGIAFLHLSTDYVFDGSGERPWVEDDRTGPLSVYGQSKLLGEEGVRDAGGRYAILRTSWVFSAQGTNFVRTMLRLGQERPEINVVDDQWGGPTPAAAIAAALLRMAEALVRGSGPSGTWHFSGEPDVTWAGFAREIFAQAGLNCRVNGIPSTAWPTPARRPRNSRLDCRAIEGAYGIVRPDWRQGLSDVLEQLGTGGR